MTSGCPQVDPTLTPELVSHIQVKPPRGRGVTTLRKGTVLFTLALFASLPIGFVFQFIPSAQGKNAYSLVAGKAHTAISYTPLMNTPKTTRRHPS